MQVLARIRLYGGDPDKLQQATPWAPGNAGKNLEFVAASPKTIAAITVEALAAALSERRTKLVLEAAEGKGLVHRRQDAKDRRKAWYSTEPMPENDR